MNGGNPKICCHEVFIARHDPFREAQELLKVSLIGSSLCQALEESRQSTVLREKMPVPLVPALPPVSQQVEHPSPMDRAPGAELRMPRQVPRNGRRRFSSLDRRGAVRAAAGLRWGL